MRKTPLYSRSHRARSAGRDDSVGAASPPAAAATGNAGARTTPQAVAANATAPKLLSPPSRWLRLGKALGRHERLVFTLAGALFAVGLVALHAFLVPEPSRLTQKNIDAAVLHTLENVNMPSMAAVAYEAIEPSVVAVRSFVVDDGKDKEGKAKDRGAFKSGEKEAPASKSGNKPADGPKSEVKKEGDDEPGFKRRGIGTGTVILDNGTILTSLHVVAGADKIKVEFYDGTVSEAYVIGARPEHDMAVLKARRLPDDLKPATMRSTADLRPGDEVVAVGFPFGIGPSASYGVVSGLKREYLSPEGKVLLTNLIQFDAAANPGNSGGPLVTKNGEVVGIVTAILNPTEQRVFVGIGFAVPIENAAAAVGQSPF